MTLWEDTFKNPKTKKFKLYVTLGQNFADQVNVSVNPYTPPPPATASYKFQTIVIQDTVTGQKYTWSASTGSWDNQPEITPGANSIAITVTVLNLNVPGNGTLTIIPSAGGIQAITYTIPNTIATGTTSTLPVFHLPMPSSAMTISIAVTP